MNNFKEMLRYEKENMPTFLWQFEKFMVVFLIVGVGGAIITLIIGLLIGILTDGNGLLISIPFIVWFSLNFVMLVLFVIKSISVKRKTYEYNLHLIKTTFYNMDFAIVKQKLIEENRITEEGFILDEDTESKHIDDIVPFSSISILFDPNIFYGKIFLDTVGKQEYEYLWIKQLDNYFYNFLMNNLNLVENQAIFKLFVEDKERFVKLFLKYKDVSKMEKVLSKQK